MSEVEVQEALKEQKTLRAKKSNLELFMKQVNRKLKGLYKELPIEEKSTPEAIKLIVDQYDKDNSGMLNFQEFLRFLKDMELAGSDDDQQIESKFTMFMKIGEEDDKSGAVGDEEIIKYIQQNEKFKKYPFHGDCEIEKIRKPILCISLPFLFFGLFLLIVFLGTEKDGFDALYEKDGFPELAQYGLIYSLV